MNLVKRYEERLRGLETKKMLLEKEIECVAELLEDLRKEEYNATRISEIKPKTESNEFANVETAEATKVVLNEALPEDMHQKDIAREMFRRGWSCTSKTPDQTIATALGRLGDNIIEKTGKGRYRLKRPLNGNTNGNGRKKIVEPIGIS